VKGEVTYNGSDMMFRPSKISMARIASALLIAEMLVFAIGIMPEHVFTLSSHDNCEICALIQHPPVLQVGDIAPIDLILQRSLLATMAAQPAVLEPKIESRPSRAPPT
jgi:hypothetical protein